jgi:AAA domain
VLISTGHPLKDAASGVIVDVAATWLRVATAPGVAKQLHGGGFRIDLAANAISYERATAAINTFQLLPSASAATYHLHRCAFDLMALHALQQNALVAAKFARTKFCMLCDKRQARGLRRLLGPCRLLHGGSAAETLPDLAATTPQFVRVHQALEPGGTEKRLTHASNTLPLNSSQCAAIRKACHRTLTLWQGPPGTGKTRTLAAFVAFMQRTVLTSGVAARCLACAGSNVAVDNLTEAMLQLGLRVVRVGQPAKISKQLVQASLDAHVAAHSQGVRFWCTLAPACRTAVQTHLCTSHEVAAQQGRSQADPLCSSSLSHRSAQL